MNIANVMALADAYAAADCAEHHALENESGIVFEQAIADTQKARAALEAAVTVLEKDAKRYQWFADIAVSGAFDKAEAAFACFEHAESCTKTELDEAIDKAMEAK